jgi:hypothetical protein
MKIKTKKRRDRAARRAGVCKQCAAVEAFKLPVGAKEHASAPCAKCGRLVIVDLRILENPNATDALIRAVSPYPDVCFAKFEVVSQGETIPEDTPAHCDKAHVLLIKKFNDRDEDTAVDR